MTDDRANQDEMSGPETDLQEQNPGQTTAGDFGADAGSADEDLDDTDLDDADLDEEATDGVDATEDLGRAGEDTV